MLDRSETGDTLVEVLIAVAILSVAIIGAMAAMTFGQGVALRAVERTEVQGTMNSQLSYLRYARDQRISNPASTLWADILAKANASTVEANSCAPGTRPGTFYMSEFLGATPPAVVSTTAQNAATIPTLGNGIWVEARSGGAAPAAYVDFYVKACWTPVNGDTLQESRTVMRLYVPA